MAYQLRNWYFDSYQKKGEELWNVYGDVYGHQGFREGTRIHTSAILSIQVGLHALEVRTRNSVYTCPYDSCQESIGRFLDVERLFPEPPGEEEMQALVSAIYAPKRREER